MARHGKLFIIYFVYDSIINYELLTYYYFNLPPKKKKKYKRILEEGVVCLYFVQLWVTV